MTMQMMPTNPALDFLPHSRSSSVSSSSSLSRPHSSQGSPFGRLPPDDLSIKWQELVFKMLTVRGVYGRQMFETWYEMSVLIQSGLDISPVITHRFPYTQFKEAIELMKSGNSGKIVLDWSERSL